MIIVGVVGVASVLTGLLYLQPLIFDLGAKESYITVAIEGLKVTYKVNEPIDFTIMIEGYVCDRGFPSVAIYKESTGEIVWSRLGEIRLFPVGYSCPHKDIHHVKHIGDVERYNNDEQDRMRTQGGVPIVISKEWKYVVESVTKGFTVIS